MYIFIYLPYIFIIHLNKGRIFFAEFSTPQPLKHCLYNIYIV